MVILVGVHYNYGEWGIWLPRDITSIKLLFLWYLNNFMGTDEAYFY